MSRKQATVWFGMLEAGAKGSLVVRDDALETGSPATFYLFNLKKGKILEYRRDLAELKLRELRADELDLVESLRTAFETAREGFSPRGARRRISRPYRRSKADDDEIPDITFDDAALDDVDIDVDGDAPLIPPDPDLDGQAEGESEADGIS